jgi:hypothetical protein
MKDFFTFVGSILVFAIVVVSLIVGIASGIDYLECQGFKNTGYETKWEWSCYANVDGHWVPRAFVFGNAQEVRLKHH